MGLFLVEDLSPEERKHQCSLVAEMKKARNERKQAFVRHRGGKLIVEKWLSHLLLTATSDMCKTWTARSPGSAKMQAKKENGQLR